jgi:hypothetical protein
MEYEYNKENFDKIMEEFVKLNINLKRSKIIEELKLLIAYHSKLCMLNNTDFNIMYNKEMGDLNSDNVNEKDFLEALYAYLYILKSADLKFVNSLTNKLLEISNLK